MENPYHNVKFLLSAPSIRGCPEDTGFEVVIAGRSNAGKSSAINTLTGQKKLARVSKTPGRTQHLVYFELDSDRKIVDLPGYGFAKVPLEVKKKWHQSMEEFFQNRKAISGGVIVMDIRHPLMEFDQMMLNWMTAMNIPVHILLTKADKLSFGAAKNVALKINKTISIYQNVSVQTFSSLKNSGIEELHQKLNQFLNYEN
jgi:GTP-binding protein